MKTFIISIALFVNSLICSSELISTQTSTKQGKENAYGLSVCAIFRNDGKYLPEWIECHIKQGVNHFYLYDNKSEDGFMKFINKYIDQEIVTLTDWPHKFERGENGAQCMAYMHCVENYGHESDWIAFLDTDEFLFCPDGMQLIERLDDYKAYGAVSACYVLYGTSNTTVPPGGKIVDHLLMRTEKKASKCVKTIAQPQYIQRITSAHYVILKDKDQVTEYGEPFHGLISPSPSVDLFRINHYWSRDLDFFHHVKLSRKNEMCGVQVEDLIKKEKTMNAVYDPILRDLLESLQ